MIQLFNSLIVPEPTNIQNICTPSGSSTTTYGNWGYAQINAAILTSGQKYNIRLQNPGYVVLNLGYYTATVNFDVTGSVNYNYNGFNLNDYNNYINNTNIKAYTLDVVNFNSLSTAYAYVDSNGFVIDLTELPSNYAVILGLLKFDYIKQFNTVTVTEAGTTFCI